jgi:hypothetical protein
MYKLKGYIVEDLVGNVVNYSNNRATATQFANQHGLPEHFVKQTFVHSTPVYKTEEDKEIKLYAPNQQGFLVEVKDDGT